MESAESREGFGTQSSAIFHERNEKDKSVFGDPWEGSRECKTVLGAELWEGADSRRRGTNKQTNRICVTAKGEYKTRTRATVKVNYNWRFEVREDGKRA
ncbi:hypothetical protein L596_015221 [Steinernema carpocapsae]|uniref:Uncharacterized protein n=1 Tax=Steinernema carpocapsae TaxID=34508 RepID=A0A4U5NEJ6_STECR|nr:hypothetical protein L596_015221 [Steinernema carpocapsae]